MIQCGFLATESPVTAVYPDFAELAIEAQFAQHDVALTEVSFALELESMAAGARRAKLEEIAARFELSPDATCRVLDQWTRRAQLLHEAAGMLKRYGPQIRQFIADENSFRPVRQTQPLPPMRLAMHVVCAGWARLYSVILGPAGRR
jgi:hypothetical protein